MIKVKIEGGDGDQRFFGSPQYLEEVEKCWFTGSLGDWHGRGRLFRVYEGSFARTYVALTSRVLMPLIEQFEKRGWASVIVHVVTNPTDTFDGGYKDIDSLGMSVADVISP